MKFDLKDILKYEFIGLKAEVVDSRNKANIGIKGKIVDETRNTLVIETSRGRKKLMKENITVMVMFDNKKIKIRGKLLVGRPEERIKR